MKPQATIHLVLLIVLILWNIGVIIAKYKLKEILIINGITILLFEVCNLIAYIIVELTYEKN